MEQPQIGDSVLVNAQWYIVEELHEGGLFASDEDGGEQEFSLGEIGVITRDGKLID